MVNYNLYKVIQLYGNNMKNSPLAALFLFTFMFTSVVTSQATVADTLSIERIFSAPALYGTAPGMVKLSPDGQRVTFIRAKANDTQRFDLWEYHIKDQQSRLLFDADDLHTGDENLCAAATPTIMSHDGFANKVRANEKAVVALPDGMDAQSAGPLFCGGITVFNPLVQFDIKPTDKVAVIGIGGLGHLALQFLNAWGCEVTAFTSSEAKSDEAKSLGAHHTLNSRDSSEIEAAANQFDFIISTVNVKLDWNLYLSTLKPKGRLHFVGATLEPLDLGAFGLIGGQKQVSGSPVGSPATITQMLEFAVQHNIKPHIETFKMSDVNNALAHLKSGKARYRIVLEKD